MHTIVIVPGFNEPASDLRWMQEGRDGAEGFGARGFVCHWFDQHHDSLDDRIDRYRDALLALERDDPARFPVVSFGYSLGGIVVRGLLRKYPDEAKRLISHTIQVGAPNWGIAVDVLPILTGAIRLPDHTITDIDLRSRFMTWFNGCGGSWAFRPGEREKFWKLDSDPTIAPDGAKILSIYGRVPHFGDDNDGIVWCDSATLGGRITSHAILHEDANHLNLVGLFNLGTRVFKGFIRNDEMWPKVIDATVRFVLSDDPGPKPEGSNRAEDPLGVSTGRAE